MATGRPVRFDAHMVFQPATLVDRSEAARPSRLSSRRSRCLADRADAVRVSTACAAYTRSPYTLGGGRLKGRRLLEEIADRTAVDGAIPLGQAVLPVGGRWNGRTVRFTCGGRRFVADVRARLVVRR